MRQVEQGAVHFSVVVFEDAQVRNLLRELDRTRFRVARNRADEHEQTRIDRADEYAFDVHLSATHSLEHAFTDAQ